jgi:antibiotic biosynthesis monooxygenase (ABM) superfamily enzyme
MITHVVLLKPKAEVSESEIATALDHVQGLQKDIPGIIETQAGANLSSHNQGYTYGFVMRFVDAEHLKAYAPHPAHQVVSKELRDMCESIIDFDLE